MLLWTDNDDIAHRPVEEHNKTSQDLAWKLSPERGTMHQGPSGLSVPGFRQKFEAAAADPSGKALSPK